MPKINIEHNSSQAPAECLNTLKNFFENDQDLKKVDPNIKAQFAEGQMGGKVQGSQFKADIQVKAVEQGSLVNVVIDLPLLLTPFKGKVEESIKRKLAKYLA